MISNKVVNTKHEIPSRSTLSPVVLNKIYNVCVKKTKEQLQYSTNYPTITCDIWSDQYKHCSYICVTIHFLDSNFQLHKYSLRTQPFNESHTGESIRDLISNILNEFNINPNNIIVVSKFMGSLENSCLCLSRYQIKLQTCVRHGNYYVLFIHFALLMEFTTC